MPKGKMIEPFSNEKKKSYRLSTPEEQWFVPDNMYIVDSRLSRDENVIALETRYDVVTDPELSDECHLVWKNYHSLSEERIKSFLTLKPCGMYLLIDCARWMKPTDELEYAEMNKNFSALANDKTDKIAQLVHDYPEHFEIIDFTQLSFVIEVHHSDVLHEHRFKNRLYKYYEIYSNQKHLKWTFNNIDPNKPRPKTKFCIDIHMNTNSYFIGIKLLEWEDSYPCYWKTMRFGSPIREIIRLLDVKPGMIVMDLDIGFAENVLEFSHNTKVHTIGLIVNERHMKSVLKNFHYAESDYIKNQYHNLMMCESFDSVPNFFNTAVLDRVILYTTSGWDQYQIQKFLRRLEKFLLTCSIGCIALISLPLEDDSDVAVGQVFHRSPYFDVIMVMAHFEICQQLRLYKVLRKTPAIQFFN